MAKAKTSANAKVNTKCRSEPKSRDISGPLAQVAALQPILGERIVREKREKRIKEAFTREKVIEEDRDIRIRKPPKDKGLTS